MNTGVCIGTSGWNYKTWKTSFYAGVPQKDWLRFCAQCFTGIEVNATFYRLHEKRTFESWREETPEQFCFAIKGRPDAAWLADTGRCTQYRVIG